jgi:ketosteroid isomerase-like protein
VKIKQIIMKNFTLSAALLLFASLTNAQKMKSSDLDARVKLIEDRLALKELVDVFSNLADQKDVEKQLDLFTDDATVASVVDGQAGAPLVGKKQIGDAFSSFLKNYEMVYHVNGQQTVTVNGDKASGVSYCMVTLVGTENGKKMKTTMWICYNDEYVRKDTKWLITNRKSNFIRREVEEVTQ